MLKGTWLLPSLDRADELKKFFEAYADAEWTTPVLVMVDKEDPQKDAYLALELPKKCELILTDAKTMGDKVRSVWERVVNMDWVGILNDDHRPRTKEGDLKILGHINGTNVVCTNDGWVAPQRICGAICFSGKFLRTLGYMFLPGQHHLFSDDLWAHICNRAQCAQILMDVLVEHEHAYKNEKKRDNTFVLINGEKGLQANGQGEAGFWPGDREVFFKWFQSPQNEEDCQKILDIQPKVGVMIATPFHDGQNCVGYTLGLADTTAFLMGSQIHHEMARVIGSSLIPHARNSLVDMFLKSRCEKIIMIDSDQGFDRRAVAALLQSPRKIVAGITPHKRFPMNFNFEPLPKHNKYFQSLTNKSMEEFKVYAQKEADAQGLIEVNRIGTGFVMMDRRVFEVLAEYVGEYEPFDDKPNVKHKEYFVMGGFNSRYRGEDWYFCEMAKKAGLQVYINANAIVSHQGSFVFQAM